MLLAELLENPATLLSLETEELATYLLERFAGTSPQNIHSLYNFIDAQRHSTFGISQEVEVALTEAWWWLAREGFILESGSASSSGWYYISSRGKRALESSDRLEFHHVRLLPRQMLHPLIAAKVFAPYLRADYETAVFVAFKEVEIAVRSAANLPHTLVGVDLMRKAFHEASGPLRNTDQPSAEREALAHLFAGAIGSYKNPSSHRRVIIEAAEAAEMIILASHLLNIVDARVSLPTNGAE